MVPTFVLACVVRQDKAQRGQLLLAVMNMRGWKGIGEPHKRKEKNMMLQYERQGDNNIKKEDGGWACIG